MDKRKGIILAIVLFLIIGLGTFVFAGSDEEPENGTIPSQQTGEGENGSENNPSDSNEEINDGNLTGEGGTEKPSRDDVTTPVVDEVETPVTDGNNANTIDWASLLNELAQMVNTAEDRKDIEAAIEFRKNNNITAENIESLGETALDSLKTVNAILDDETAPAIEPDLDGKFFKEVSISINDDTKYTFVLERLDGESIPEGTTLDNINLEGEYKLTAVDAAFNETVVTFTIDRNETEETKTTMDVNNATHFDSIEDAVATITDLSLDKVVVENQDTKESVTFVAENGNVEIKLTEEATYKLTAYDKAGNETTYWLAVDETDPTIFFTDSEGNELSDLTNKDVTITAFDKFLTEVTVPDANGNETVYKEFTTNGNNENKTFTLTLGEDGIYTITAKDKVGRKITETIEIDKTKIAVDHLYVLNNSHNDYEVSDNVRYKVIGNGQDLYVEYVLKEEFSSTPVITIGGQEFEMTCGTALWDDSLYKCDAHITITEDMGLKNGEIIPFTITGVKDIAGNETTVTEENVTVIEKYGRVIYDNEAPEPVELSIQNLNRYGTDLQQFAKNGETIRVRLYFNELLAVEPTVSITGTDVTATATYRSASSQNGRYAYYADIKITEDMELPDGNIEFSVYGYGDYANNIVSVDESLTEEDTIGNDDCKSVYLDNSGAVIVQYENVQGWETFVNKDYVEVIVSDASGIDSAYYTWSQVASGYVEAVNEIDAELIIDNEDGTYTIKVPTVDGRNKLHIKVVDKLGNETTDYNSRGNYNIDRDDPDVILKRNNKDEVTPGKHNYCVAATITDDNLLSVTLNGQDYVSGTMICGEDNYELIATDKANNATPIIFSIETSKPIINVDGTDYTGEESGNNFIELGRYDSTPTVTITEANMLYAKVWYDGVLQEDYTKVDYSQQGLYQIEVCDEYSNKSKVEFYVGKYRTFFKITGLDNLVYDGDGIKDEITIEVVDDNGTVIGKPSNYTFYKETYGGEVVSDPTDAGTYVLAVNYYDPNGEYENNWTNEYVFTIEQATTEIVLIYPDSLIADGASKVFKVELWDVSNEKFIKDLTPIFEDSNSNPLEEVIAAGKYTLIVQSSDMNNYKASSIRNEFEILPERTTSLVDGVSYESLSDAVEAAKASGSTVELVDDITVSTSDYIEIKNGEVNIDLNGNNIMFESSRFSISDNGTLNLTGEGTISSNVAGGGPIYLSGSTDSSATAYANLNVGKDVTVEGNNGILIFTIDGKRGNAYGVNVKIDGTVRAIDVGNAPANIGVYVTGNLRNATTNAPIITLSETARVESGGVGIYAAGYATWNINGAYIEGAEQAVGIKSGILNMNSGTLKSNGTLNIPTEPFGNGMNSSGAALQIESNASYVGEMEINISGGRLISENAVAIYEYGQKDIDTKVQKINITGGEFISTNYKENFLFSTSFNDTFDNGFITGGTFNRNENDALLQYIADGYTVVEQDGNYVVVAE